MRIAEIDILSSNLLRFIFAAFTLSFFCIVVAAEQEQNTLQTAQSQACHKIDKDISFIDSGCISSGLLLLDSIIHSSPLDSKRTETIVKKAFRLLSYGTKGNTEKQSSLEFGRYFIDTISFSSFRCAVVSRSQDKKSMLPSFSYSIRFPIEKPYLLSFSGLNRKNRPRLSMKHAVIDTTLSYDIVDQIDTKEDSISCSIFIDPNNSGLTLYDYINDFVNGVFDSVSIRNDLKKYDALSLRGYNRKFWSFEKGRFTAIIAFDRLIPDRRKVKGKETVIPMPVRYTVVMQSAGSVRELAEAKLQTLLKTL